jgi:hypothetical protein
VAGAVSSCGGGLSQNYCTCCSVATLLGSTVDPESRLSHHDGRPIEGFGFVSGTLGDTKGPKVCRKEGGGADPLVTVTLSLWQRQRQLPTSSSLPRYLSLRVLG